MISDIVLAMGILSLGFSVMYAFSETETIKKITKYTFLVLVIVTCLEISTISIYGYVAYLALAILGFTIIMVALDYMDVLLGIVGWAFLGRPIKIKK